LFKTGINCSIQYRINVDFIYINGYFNLTGFSMGNIHIMVNNRLINSIFTASIFLLAQSTSYAGVYKWVDENGQVHYGEKPGNTGAEEVTIRQNETTTPRAIKKTEGDEDSDETTSEETAQKEPEWVEVPVPKKEKRKLCNEAKSDLAAISGRGRMREINEKGEYIFLTEEQRQQRISAAKKKQKKYCR
jgi:hypothetical protein